MQVMDVEDDDEVVHRSHKLKDLIDYFLADEYMTGDNKYHCMRCEELRVGGYFLQCR